MNYALKRKKMILLKFKDSGTSAGIADGLTKQLMYHYAFHKLTPKQPTGTFYEDFWDLHTKILAHYKEKCIPTVKNAFNYDETKDKMFTEVIDSGPLEEAPHQWAVIKTDPSQLGYMNMWGQIFGTKGTLEVLRKNVKTRITTLVREIPQHDVRGDLVCGYFPYGIIYCAEQKGLLVDEAPWTTSEALAASIYKSGEKTW
jgi:hypothetical protein